MGRAGAHSREAVRELLKLVLAPHQWGQAASFGGAEGGADLVPSEDLVCGDWLGLAANLEGAGGAHLEEPAHQAVRGLAHQDRSRRGQRLQAGGEVGGIADRRVVHLEVVADGADDDRSGMDTDARGELEAASGVQAAIEITERLLDLPGGTHAAVGRILVRHGRAEQRHHAVAGQLIDDAFEAINLVKGQLQVLIEEVAIFLRIEALGDRR